jgi:alpha-amylase
MVLAGQVSAGVMDGASGVVLLQGFHWESHLSTTWWDVLAAKASDISASGIDGVWLPPSSAAASDEGYLPTRLYYQYGGYGTQAKLQAAITALHTYNVKAIADIVINHRCGTTGWGDFTDPVWVRIRLFRRRWSGATGAADTGEGYGAARDIDHTKAYVRTSIIEWLNWMKSTIGYDGWRYDMVRGYSGYYNNVYNTATSPWISIANVAFLRHQQLQSSRQNSATGSTRHLLRRWP